jgi:ABC-type transporter Mla subunit MlaD
VCSDVSTLHSSVASLAKINPSKDTAGQLGDNLSQVKSDLDKLSADAGSQWSSQIDSLKSALSSAQGAVTRLGSGSGAISSATSSIGSVISATVSLFSAVKSTCP